MEKYLTAEQAYELAANWQEIKLIEAVETTLKKIEEQAKKGLFCTGIYDPAKDTNLDRDSYLKKMKSLGYVFDSCHGDYIYWKWDKLKA